MSTYTATTAEGTELSDVDPYVLAAKVVRADFKNNWNRLSTSEKTELFYLQLDHMSEDLGINL